MPIYVSVPGASSVVSRSASPGGGWNAGSPSSALDVVDGVLLSAAAWNGSSSNWTSGESDYLYASSFGLGINPTDTLVSIVANFTCNYATFAGQGYVLTIGDTVGVSLDTIQCYNGSTIGSATSESLSNGVNSVSGITFNKTMAATPTISQLNNSNFGLIIGASFTHGGPGTFASLPPGHPLTVGIDQILLTVTTMPASGGGGDGVGSGGGNGPPVKKSNVWTWPNVGQLKIQS